MHSENTFTNHTGRVTTLIQLKDKRIVSGSSDCKIIVWDLKKKTKNAKELNAHRHIITDLVQLRNNSLASGSFDCTIRLWDINFLNCLNVIRITNNAVLLYWKMETMILQYRIIQLFYGMQSIKKKVNILKGHNAYISYLVTLKNKRLASGSHDCNYIIWVTKRFTRICMINLGSQIIGFCLLNDNTLLVYLNWQIHTINLQTMKTISSQSTTFNITACANLENGQIGISRYNIILACLL